LKKTLELFDNIAIAFSGAEDMAVNHRKHIQVFCLETGRLHPETYRFIEKNQKPLPDRHWNIIAGQRLTR